MLVNLVNLLGTSVLCKTLAY